MSSYYGSKFADLWSGIDINQVKSDWAAALATYTPEEIGRGLGECLRHDWPPTLPEFLKRCRPALDPEAAYWEAVKIMPLRHSSSEHIRESAKFSHPAIFWAAAELGNDLSAGYERIKVRWRMALEAAYTRCYEVGGKFAAIPEPAPQLEHQPTPVSDEERAEKIAQLKQKIGIGFGQVEGATHQTEQQRKQALEKLDKVLAERGES